MNTFQLSNWQNCSHQPFLHCIQQYCILLSSDDASHSETVLWDVQRHAHIDVHPWNICKQMAETYCL